MSTLEMVSVKYCNDCKQAKPEDEFYLIQSKGKRRLSAYCRICWRKRAKNYRENLTAEQRAAYDQRRRDTGYNRKRNLKEIYKISEEDYARMLDEQGGVCKICSSPPTEGKHLTIDHDHACCPSRKCCGKCIRGLLCSNCNSILGLSGDDVVRLARAVDYLLGTLP